MMSAGLSQWLRLRRFRVRSSRWYQSSRPARRASVMMGPRGLVSGALLGGGGGGEVAGDVADFGHVVGSLGSVVVGGGWRRCGLQAALEGCPVVEAAYEDGQGALG